MLRSTIDGNSSTMGAADVETNSGRIQGFLDRPGLGFLVAVCRLLSAWRDTACEDCRVRGARGMTSSTCQSSSNTMAVLRAFPAEATRLPTAVPVPRAPAAAPGAAAPPRGVDEGGRRRPLAEPWGAGLGELRGGRQSRVSRKNSLSARNSMKSPGTNLASSSSRPARREAARSSAASFSASPSRTSGGLSRPGPANSSGGEGRSAPA
mmetsp:Transcript_76318/g.241343  ORF Transcript_76318/g.241343 Transcript_76318/m.241343 type:complete len:208 (-) Transcript_76318:569-1192(-)